jgi:hypothetical protein
LTALSAEQGENQGEQYANDKACNDREIKRRIPTLDTNITGKSSEPAGTKAGPKGKSNNRYYAPEESEHSTELPHATT